MKGFPLTPPLYDRRRLETLVMEHRMRVHLAQKKTGGSRTAGAKTSGK